MSKATLAEVRAWAKTKDPTIAKGWLPVHVLRSYNLKHPTRPYEGVETVGGWGW